MNILDVIKDLEGNAGIIFNVMRRTSDDQLAEDIGDKLWALMDDELRRKRVGSIVLRLRQPRTLFAEDEVHVVILDIVTVHVGNRVHLKRINGSGLQWGHRV